MKYGNLEHRRLQDHTKSMSLKNSPSISRCHTLSSFASTPSPMSLYTGYDRYSNSKCEIQLFEKCFDFWGCHFFDLSYFPCKLRRFYETLSPPPLLTSNWLTIQEEDWISLRLYHLTPSTFWPIYTTTTCHHVQIRYEDVHTRNRCGRHFLTCSLLSR